MQGRARRPPAREPSLRQGRKEHLDINLWVSCLQEQLYVLSFALVVTSLTINCEE